VVIYSTEYCSIRVEANPIPTHKLHASHTDFFLWYKFFFTFILGDTESPYNTNSIYMNYSFKITDFFFRKWHTGTRCWISKCAIYIYIYRQV